MKGSRRRMVTIPFFSCEATWSNWSWLPQLVIQPGLGSDVEARSCICLVCTPPKSREIVIWGRSAAHETPGSAPFIQWWEALSDALSFRDRFQSISTVEAQLPFHPCWTSEFALPVFPKIDFFCHVSACAWKLPYALHRNLFPDVCAKTCQVVAVIMTLLLLGMESFPSVAEISGTRAQGSPTMGRAESVTRKEWEVPFCQGVDGWNGNVFCEGKETVFATWCELSSDSYTDYDNVLCM